MVQKKCDDCPTGLADDVQYIRSRLDSLYDITSDGKERTSKVEVKLDNHLKTHWAFYALVTSIGIAIIGGIKFL